MSAETSHITDISAAASDKKPKRPEQTASGASASQAQTQRKPMPRQESSQNGSAWGNVDVVKFFDEGRERLREAFEQASGRFEHVRCAARDTSDVLQDCHTATISGIKEINEHALENLQTDIDRMFDYGRQITDAKTLSDVLEANGTFVRESLETSMQRARTFGELSANLVRSTFEPFQSGMANVLAQARKRSE